MKLRFGCTCFGNSAYPIHPYLLKNYKAIVTNPKFNEKKIFNESINLKRFIIKYALRTLKNQWTILKNFNMDMSKVAAVTLACYILHNFCKIHSEQV